MILFILVGSVISVMLFLGLFKIVGKDWETDCFIYTVLVFFGSWISVIWLSLFWFDFMFANDSYFNNEKEDED